MRAAFGESWNSGPVGLRAISGKAQKQRPVLRVYMAKRPSGQQGARGGWVGGCSSWLCVPCVLLLRSLGLRDQ